MSDQDREYIRGKLERQLDKFKRSIERVTVRVTDINGPRGGVDLVCAVKVVLSGRPSVVVERRDARLRVAVDAALRAATQAVRRHLTRRRVIRRTAGTRARSAGAASGSRPA